MRTSSWSTPARAACPWPTPVPTPTAPRYWFTALLHFRPLQLASVNRLDSSHIVTSARFVHNSLSYWSFISAQFFITTALTPWLDGKHVVFGRVTAGKSIFSLLIDHVLVYYADVWRGSWGKPYLANLLSKGHSYCPMLIATHLFIPEASLFTTLFP